MKHAIRRDLKIAVKNLPYLPLVFGDNPRSVIRKETEFRNIISVLNPFKRKPNAQGVYNNNEEVWFFLNGIASSPSMWEVNARMLSNMFNRQIRPLYNPTRGILVDLCESIFGRTLDKKEPCVKEHVLLVEKELNRGKLVRIIAHSQGGILVDHIVNELKNHPKLSNLEIYTFASAADEFKHPEIYSEHFANNQDYVARIGLLSYRHQICGDIYSVNESGHLLNTHYLYNFIEGIYCNKQSKLYSYLKGK